MKVVVLPEVRLYFKELAQILYEKDYFGYEEAALKYVEDLFNDIKTTLPLRYKKQAPPYFERYGKQMFYTVFRKSKNTQWYVFFNIYKECGETVYLVRFVSNNHVISHYL
ncbi:hypothetical protein Barb7_01552 [Bacteroidales bacterium Barb7]|nr:hypothetical protein Barb7_01552 [Bacteroidales bacterium Barb7]